MKRPRAKKGEEMKPHQVNAHLTDRDYSRLRSLMAQMNVHRAAITNQAIVEFLDRHCPNEKSPEAI